MRRSIDDEVAGYRGLVESLAPRFVGRNQAEFDDLVQEGLINVWETLEKGVTPKAEIIELRMLNWVRLLGAQVGRGRGKEGDAIEYAQLLPLEDFLETHVLGVDEIARPLNIGPDLDY